MPLTATDHQLEGIELLTSIHYRKCQDVSKTALEPDGKAQMKTRVFVLVPYEIPADDITEYCQLLLQPYLIKEDKLPSCGRYDYLVGSLDQLFCDDTTESRLPPRIRQSYAGNICESERLPNDVSCGALVTPDGKWHDLADFGWSMGHEPSEENLNAICAWEQHFRTLITANPLCWVVAIWAHS